MEQKPSKSGMKVSDGPGLAEHDATYTLAVEILADALKSGVSEVSDPGLASHVFDLAESFVAEALSRDHLRIKKVRDESVERIG